jgi:signal-transduction protein with cAMP-binding, CBS, and nucleotidyltransferase domain
MQVREIATSEVVSCPADATLTQAVESMLDQRVGSILVTRDGDATGIVTETDAMHAGAVTDRPFDDIEVREVMTSPLETISPRATVRDAVQQMQTADVKKLPVVEQLDVVGIVTLTDIVYHYSDIVREAQDAATRQSRWETDRDHWTLDSDD